MLWSMALIFITSCIIGTIGFAVMPLGQERLYEGKVELQLSGDVRLGFVGTRKEENVQLREVAVEREAEVCVILFSAKSERRDGNWAMPFNSS